MSESRRPRLLENPQSQGTSRGSRKITSVASSKGGFGPESTSSTAVVPSQRTVVRSQRRWSPPCIQRIVDFPFRTFQMLPAANHTMTIATRNMSGVDRSCLPAIASPGGDDSRAHRTC